MQQHHLVCRFRSAITQETTFQVILLLYYYIYLVHYQKGWVICSNEYLNILQNIHTNTRQSTIQAICTVSQLEVIAENCMLIQCLEHTEHNNNREVKYVSALLWVWILFFFPESIVPSLTTSSVNNITTFNFQAYRWMFNSEKIENNFNLSLIWNCRGNKDRPTKWINLTFTNYCVKSVTAPVNLMKLSF